MALCGASAISVHQVDPLLWTVTLPGGINVRKEPSLKADRTEFKLSEGQLVKVTEKRGGGDGQEGDWVMLDTYSGQTGLWAKFKKGKEMYMADPLSTCWSNTECPASDDCGPCILKGKVQKVDPVPPSFPDLPQLEPTTIIALQELLSHVKELLSTEQGGLICGTAPCIADLAIGLPLALACLKRPQCAVWTTDLVQYCHRLRRRLPQWLHYMNPAEVECGGFNLALQQSSDTSSVCLPRNATIAHLRFAIEEAFSIWHGTPLCLKVTSCIGVTSALTTQCYHYQVVCCCRLAVAHKSKVKQSKSSKCCQNRTTRHF